MSLPNLFHCHGSKWINLTLLICSILVSNSEIRVISLTLDRALWQLGSELEVKCARCFARNLKSLARNNSDKANQPIPQILYGWRHFPTELSGQFLTQSLNCLNLSWQPSPVQHLHFGYNNLKTSNKICQHLHFKYVLIINSTSKSLKMKIQTANCSICFQKINVAVRICFSE